MPAPIIKIKRSAVPGKKPTVNDLNLGELALNTYDGNLFAKRIRAGINTDIINLGAGSTVTNVIYVTEDGSDENPGKKLGDAKKTIKGAIAIAESGDVIKVSAGTYLENNPIVLPNQVSVVGDSLREVTVTPQNSNSDLFHVGNGCYIAEMSFVGAASTQAIFAFDPVSLRYINQSPYIQNCTNFIQNSTGLKVDGSDALGPTKSMVLDSYTQYNQGGIGASMTNEGYAQLVSLFTICNDVAVYCGSGGACDLTNSNSSFGNYGLISDGVGPIKYTGTITSTKDENADTFTLDLNVPLLTVTNAVYDNNTGLTTITVNSAHNFNVGMGVTISDLEFSCPSGPGIVTYPSGNNGYVFEVEAVPTTTSFVVNVGTSTLPHTYYGEGNVKINVMRPFDGQVIYFDDLYQSVARVRVSAGGTGYLDNPVVTISDPTTDFGIAAQAVAEINENGSVVNIEMVSSGRGYTSPPTITITGPDIGINTATATPVMIPTYYSILNSTPISSGICTITVNENVPYVVGVGTTVPFYKQSRVLASGISFEYVGSGTEIVGALPSQGGVPDQDKETDSRLGGLVVFTSTDQSGNFKIGDGVVINQQTGTISGTFYSKSLFSTLTPFILALGGE